MRSNSLGVQLKKTEKELKQHEQEIVDQQQLHELTVKELELVKAAHMISQEECQQLKNRVSPAMHPLPPPPPPSYIGPHTSDLIYSYWDISVL